MIMLPELIVIGTAFAVLGLDLLISESYRRVLAPLALVGLAIATGALVLAPLNAHLLGGRFTLDAVAWWFKLMFLTSAFFTVLLSRDLLDGHTAVRVRGIGFRGEYYTMLLFTLAGMMYLISARDIITLYVSLELATIPLFVLAAWRRDDTKSAEAGLKYLLLGALASAFILLGLGMIYGMTGTMDMQEICDALRTGAQPAFYYGATLLLAGVGFKLTIVPFHMWAADVYEGAPAPVTAYLSVASKGAGLALMFQLFFRMFGPHLTDWLGVIAALSAVTMTLGNAVAIVQNNIKRFMAFSAISQAGYFVMGFLGTSGQGAPPMIFYLLVYVFSNLAVFACIVWYSNETAREYIEDYAGLSQTNPIVALVLMVSLFSLAGIPPLSGFVGKFFLFSVASQAGYHWLVAVAAVNSTISLFYYLRVVRQMYIEPPKKGASAPQAPSVTLAAAMLLLCAGTALLGIVPSFHEMIQADTSQWFSEILQMR